jgi:hypothetical protein
VAKALFVGKFASTPFGSAVPKLIATGSCERPGNAREVYDKVLPAAAVPVPPGSNNRESRIMEVRES